MRLRSNCTSHKCSTRRRLRMAFAVALAAAPNLALAVEKLPRSLPGPLNHSQLDHPEHHDAGLLPYPFASSTSGESAKPGQKLERLVTLVGMQHGSLHRAAPGCDASAASCGVPQATLSCGSMPGRQLLAAGPVVPASGTQALHTEVGEVAVPPLPAPTAPSALPAAEFAEVASSLPELAPARVALPSVPSPSVPSPSKTPAKLLPSTASQAVSAAPAAEAADDFDELSQSLIDIDIPLDLVQPVQPPQLSEAEPISLGASSVTSVPASPTAVAAPPDRQPELIQPAKSLSLTQRQPSAQSVNLSLNDTPASAPSAASPVPSSTTAATSSPGPVAPDSPRTYALSDATLDEVQSSERGVALHLSSASQVPMKAAAGAMAVSPRPQVQPPSGGMQVRIEGEPAPLLNGRLAEGLHSQGPAAPLPSMERFARLATPAPTEQHEANHKVKAAFATRTSIVPDRALEPLVSVRGRDAKQVRAPLTLGLQQSQTLSAEFVITELSVEHPSICQLMQTGESSVSLVGIRPGDTRIALVMINDSGERQVEIHEVSVASATGTSQSLPEMAAEISRTVGSLVPNSDVEVVAYEDYLLVHGFTHYESDAKKILSLVRRTSLVPVVDQLRSNEQ